MAALMSAVAGCGWRTSPEPLKPNPATTDAVVRAQVDAQLLRAARAMSAAEAAKLVEGTPDRDWTHKKE